MKRSLFILALAVVGFVPVFTSTASAQEVADCYIDEYPEWGVYQTVCVLPDGEVVKSKWRPL